MLVTLNNMMNSAIWQINRFGKYYFGTIKHRLKSRNQFSLIELLFTPISIIPMCIVLMRIDFHSIYNERVSIKSKIGSFLTSVRSENEMVSQN